MNIADRVKQDGTATSDAIYVLSGAAADGHVTFETGFQVPTVGDLGGTPTWDNVPILVESGTDWQIITATLQRDGSGVVSILNGVVRASSTGSALGLTGSAAVTLTVVPSYWSFGMVDFAQRTPTDDVDLYTQRPKASGGGLMALGPRSFASKTHATAQGQNAYAHAPYEDVLGCGNWPDGEGGAAMRGRSVMMAKTVDATATKLSAADEFGAIASSNAISTDSGLYVIRGTLTAIDHTSGDKKLWDIAFAIETEFDYSATALFGTLTKTVVNADAGASAWDVAVTVSGNAFSVEVTGEAATEISWVFSYDAHYHIVYP